MKKVSSDVITGKSETFKYTAWCTKVKVPDLWTLLRELHVHTRLKWKGTGHPPAHGVPYPRLAGGIKFLRVEKGVMSYHASVDKETKLMNEDKFIAKMKKEFPRGKR